MAFTTSCFVVVKNNDQATTLLTKLRELGDRRHLERLDNVPFPCVCAVSTNIISVCELSELASSGFVDCGENEEMFLAIASLRKDSDIHQWFTDGSKWVISDIHSLLELKEYFQEIGFDYSKTHKASAEELIFKYNKMKQFKGKAIYNPSGKAGEYSYWACNLYNGCSNGCEYCYCKKGFLAKSMGGDVPTLKKGLINEDKAVIIAESEIMKNLDSLREKGLFFTFSSDPMLLETQHVFFDVIDFALSVGVNVKILTKRTEWATSERWFHLVEKYPDIRKRIAIGFTLTGRDDKEPFASPNSDRIITAHSLADQGFILWASIEPIIDLRSSLDMIMMTIDSMKLYKIGLLSGGKYDLPELYDFVQQVGYASEMRDFKVYWKESILKKTLLARNDMPGVTVDSDYNIFKSNKKKYGNSRKDFTSNTADSIDG